tara:strand:- start:23282 stop:24124 length:843 start_codon:yes stop_codon:yes gene_type:complete
MEDNHLVIKDLKRGLSGCKITISNEGGLVKTSPSIIYNDRLKKQIKKQKEFSKQSYINIQVPKILTESFKNNLYSVEMEYIQAESEIKFFNHSSIEQVNNTLEIIYSYIYQLTRKSYESNFTEKIHEKILSLKKKSKHSSVIDLLLKIINKREIILPYSNCHGDLTLSNILFKNDCIYFIDFLDSYIDSYLCDIIKLKQDLFYLWNLQLNDEYNLRHKIIYRKYWDFIYKKNLDYLQSLEFKILDIVNFLRIEPYAKSPKHIKLVKCIIERLSEEIKCII